MASLDTLLAEEEIVVCVGAGGVGKTTTSAALGLRAALAGRKVLVLTVDPARRLANALGMEEMLATPTQVSLSGLPCNESPHGELWAMMLDTRRIFDRVVDRYAPDVETRDRIFANPYYEQASNSLAGSQEYMAMEQLYELHEAAEFDLVILDTPPSQHALDFLDAPVRIRVFFENTAFKAVMGSSRVMGKIGKGIFQRDSMVFKGLSRFVGGEVFVSIFEFLQGFGSMTDGFAARAGELRELLESDAVSFVIMTGPDTATITEGLLFQERLQRDGLSVGQFVVNRVRPSFVKDAGKTLQEELKAQLGDGKDVDRISSLVAQYEMLCRSDSAAIKVLEQKTKNAIGISKIPFFDWELHDMKGLYALQERLIG